MKFETLFKEKKPLIGIIHTGCMQGEDMLDTAKRETEISVYVNVYIRWHSQETLKRKIDEHEKFIEKYCDIGAQ